MHAEYESLRSTARLERDPELQKRLLVEIDAFEKSYNELGDSILTFKKDAEEHIRPKTFLGVTIGTPMEWLLVVGCSTAVLAVSHFFTLSYRETGVVTGIVVLLLGGFALTKAWRLKARVNARRE